MAEALRPLFGESAAQRAKRHRRAALPAKSKAQCARLDREIPATEKAETQAAAEALRPVQERLFHMRKQYAELKC